MATTQSLNMTGSGFYPNGGMSLIITTSTSKTSTFTSTADSAGSVSLTVPIASITGINGCTSLSVYAIDAYTGLSSNTVPIPVTTINPTISMTLTPGLAYQPYGNNYYTISGSGFTPNGRVDIWESPKAGSYAGTFADVMTMSADSNGNIHTGFYYDAPDLALYDTSLYVVDDTSGLQSNTVSTQN